MSYCDSVRLSKWLNNSFWFYQQGSSYFLILTCFENWWDCPLVIALLLNIPNDFLYQCQYFKVYFHFIKASSFYSAHMTVKMHSYIFRKLTFFYSLPPRVKRYTITEYAHFWNILHILMGTFLILFPNA